MARPYFRQVPNFEYVSRNVGEQNISDYIEVKNLFKRGKLREDIFGNLNYFTKYNIIGDERPDNVAYKTYGDSTLDWVVLLSNNILNVQTEWPMTQGLFDEVMLEKYGTYDNLYSGIHHHETKEVRNKVGKIVLEGGLRISPTWKTNGNFVEIINSQIQTIYAGDTGEASDEVTVILTNSIPGLKVGDQVTINNVSESVYNGPQIITEILAQDGDNVTSFLYNLSSPTNLVNPLMATPRKEEVIFVLSESSQLTANSYYYEYWDDSLGYSNYIPSSDFVVPVSNYEFEFQEQERRRSIFLLKPQYLNLIFNDLDDFMPYKKGSEQYVSRTLKRGENIRLFE